MKKILVKILTGAMIVLTACGSGDVGNKVIKPSDFLQENEHSVWFYCENDTIGKDTAITTVLEFDGGEVTAYPLDGVTIGSALYEAPNWYDLSYGAGLTLGDVAGLSDEEVIDKVKSLELEMLNEAFESAPALLEEGRDASIHEYKIERDKINDWEGLIDKRYKTLLSNIEALNDGTIHPITESAKLALITDDTGNKTEKEYMSGLHYSTYIKTGTVKQSGSSYEIFINRNNEFDEAFDSTAVLGDFSYYVALLEPVMPEPIYDSFFGGFVAEGRYGDTLLVRACKDTTEFEFDDPVYEHERFAVDPEDLDAYMNQDSNTSETEDNNDEENDVDTEKEQKDGNDKNSNITTDKKQDNNNTKTIEEYVKNDTDAMAKIKSAAADGGLDVTYSGNDIIFTYDLSSLEDVTEEVIKSDIMLEQLTSDLDSEGETFGDMCKKLEEQSGIEGIQIVIKYTYGDETIITKTFNSSGVVK